MGNMRVHNVIKGKRIKLIRNFNCVLRVLFAKRVVHAVTPPRVVDRDLLYCLY